MFENGDLKISFACEERDASERRRFLIVEQIHGSLRGIPYSNAISYFSETVCANRSHVIDNKLHLS